MVLKRAMATYLKGRLFLFKPSSRALAVQLFDRYYISDRSEKFMPKERKKFREVFSENSSEELTLLFDIEVKGEKFPKGYKFCKTDKLAGVNFHNYRYLDIAAEKEEGSQELKLVGFYPGT